MALSINLPSDFAPAAAALREHSGHPAAQQFLQQLRRDARWSPVLPRMLLRLARRLHAPVHGIDVLVVTLVGFRQRRLRRLVAALVAVAQARRRAGEYIYADGRELIIIGGDDAPRRYGVPDGFGRPMTYGSALDLGRPPLMTAEPAATPAPSPAPAPAPSAPSRPPTRPPSPGFVTR
jgi:hypothetical protein